MIRTLPAILYWFILLFYNMLRVQGNAEVDALSALKAQLHDPRDALQSWDSTLVTPCTWHHVTCDNGSKVIRVDLGNAGLSGQLVPQLGQLTNLQYLELHNNNITGRIPKELGNLTELVSLDLYMNQLEGDIPETLGNLQKLRYLDVSNNFLVGDIYYMGSFSRFTPLSFANNTDLSDALIPIGVPTPTVENNDNDKGATVGGASVGAALVFAGWVIALAWRWCRKREDHFTDVPAEEEPKVHIGVLKRFSLRELQVATDDFSNKNILGRGAFGKVYKGRLADGSLVGVKRLIDRVKGGELQFQTEVELISLAVHRNLLRLQGFCMTPTERLLVYPYMANGSVASCLKDRPDEQPALNWPARKQIALKSARGLAYLHDHCEPKIIHRDVKAANILLDEEFEAVVGDFGLAKLMDCKDTHVTTGVRGTIGHIAPEYLATGRSSEKTDVFGYGVMLLELITGKRAFDLARLATFEEVMLLDWVRGLSGNKKLEILIDVNLKVNYLKHEVEELIRIALLCTQVKPSERPKMAQVVTMLEGNGLVERWDEWRKEEITGQNFKYIQIQFNPDSTYNLSNDQLSGPR